MPADIVTRTSLHIYVTPLLKEFHWTAEKYWVQYKIPFHAYKLLHKLLQV